MFLAKINKWQHIVLLFSILNPSTILNRNIILRIDTCKDQLFLYKYRQLLICENHGIYQKDNFFERHFLNYLRVFLFFQIAILYCLEPFQFYRFRLFLDYQTRRNELRNI